MAAAKDHLETSPKETSAMSLCGPVLRSLAAASAPASSSSTLSHLLEKSQTFQKGLAGIKNPTSHNWLRKLKDKGLVTEEEMSSAAESARPLLHESALTLLRDFLAWKIQFGSTVEKRVYSDMDVLGLFDRLLRKRPLVFVGPADGYTLRDGTHGSLDWGAVGTDREGNVKMMDYMTYDEIKLAALMQVSSPCFPINTGSRDNVGRMGDGGDRVRSAVIVGAVGARFERRDPDGRMEWQEIAITKEQNVRENGYGAGRSEESLRDVFARFYGLSHFPTLAECRKKDSAAADLLKIRDDCYFDARVYTRRIELSVETFLLEAEDRGTKEGRDVYAQLTGLGLGVWMWQPTVQRELFLRAVQQVLQRNTFERVTVLDFSWIANCEGFLFEDGAVFPRTKIVTVFSRRDPFAKLPEKHASKLIVAMYAWDGNSFPGNEYWNGHLSASGDPAAACCTQIPELHNPYINDKFVSAHNLHIVSPKYGVMHVAEYAAKLLREKE